MLSSVLVDQLKNGHAALQTCESFTRLSVPEIVGKHSRFDE
jgi:hypothetical protein